MLFCYTADKGTERERLFDGATTDSKPRLRSADEIRAKYRKSGVILYSKNKNKKVYEISIWFDMAISRMPLEQLQKQGISLYNDRKSLRYKKFHIMQQIFPCIFKT